MAFAINTQQNTGGIANLASGSIVTDAAAAAAASITLGFAPRYVHFSNLTDGVTDTWFDGMIENHIYTTILGILAKLDADGGVTDTNYAALWTPAATVPGVGGPTSTPPYDVAPAAASSFTAMRTAWTGVLAKLDADAGVTDTTYTSLWNPATATKEALKASINGVTAKLDADGGVTDTNYAALWPVSLSLSQHSVIAGDKTFEKTNGIAVDGNTLTFTATTLAASKQFYWYALG